jgi:hypothetical protein
VPITDSRFARTNVRVALRQLKAAQAGSPGLAAWMAAHERADHMGGEETHGHR